MSSTPGLESMPPQPSSSSAPPPPKKAARWGLRIFVALIVMAPLAMCGGLIALGSGTKSISGATVLELDLQDGVGGGGGLLAERGATLVDVLTAIDKAKSDPHVRGLFVRVSGGEDLATAQELREALTRFRQAGKPVWAFAETFGELTPGNVGYATATAANEIWLQPSGDVSLSGLYMEMMFLRGALDKLGVQPEFSGRKEYKNAINQFMEKSFTQAHRESMLALLESLQAQIVDDIVAGRPKVGNAAAVRTLLEAGSMAAPEAMAAGLVDHLGYRGDVMAAIEAQLGEKPALLYVHRYAERVGRAFLDDKTGARVAFIDAEGQVMRGRSEVSPLGGSETLGSDTVSAALRAAAADDDVKAILLRVDSPGGSYVASDVMWKAVQDARAKGKPIVVSMGHYAASGGYFLAMGADKIFADGATLTGSIGVFSGKFVATELLDKLGVTFETLAVGNTDATATSIAVPSSPAAVAKREAMLDRIYDDFVTKAAQGRKMDKDKLEALAHGRVWTGADAKQHGLVDEVGGFLAAVDGVAGVVGGPIYLQAYPPERPTLERVIAMISGGGGENGDDVNAYAPVSLRGTSTDALRALRAATTQASADAAVLLDPMWMLVEVR